MTSRTITIAVGLVALLCGFATMGRAADASGGLAVATYQGIPYVSGGAGEEELAAMKAQEKSYNLHLLFATKTGDYLADVQVVVADQAGHKILEATSQGPLFYTNLPAGQYRVTVQAQGVSQQRTVHVAPDKPTSLDFRWANEG